MSERALLYVHIPFCIRRCCHCTACVATGGSAEKSLYLAALENEIESALSMLREYRFPAVYFGGGSPSVMNSDALAKLLRGLRDRLDFERGAETTIEIMPQTVGTPSLSGLKAGAFNRISLSMQSAIPEELVTLDCDFTLGDVRNAVLFCDYFNFKNINLDLMYGVPGQTESSMTRTMRAALSFSPSHISLYPFPGATGNFPSDSFRQQAEELLFKAGYRQYTTYHFAKNGRESKYLRLRYEGMDYVGLGLGARSLVNGISYTNTTDLDTYIANSADFEHIVTNIVKLSPEQHQEYCMRSRAMLL
jgi:oxygen-independent coproporphyrinogen-3 oxidase